MRLLLHTVLGLFRLLWVTRGRLGGAWWRWRRETVFGPPSQRPSQATQWRAMQHFLAWIWRMP
ncbi:MAG: hypothetical protein QF360_02525 [Phycisphaerales bacterium]|nr:hypothetical protein [Phycisphaerales bacterium]